MRNLLLASFVVFGFVGCQTRGYNQSSAKTTESGATAFTCTFSDSRGPDASLTLVKTGANTVKIVRQGAVETAYTVKGASKSQIEGYTHYRFDFGNGDGLALRVWSRGGSSSEGSYFTASGKVVPSTQGEVSCHFGEINADQADLIVSNTAYQSAGNTIFACTYSDFRGPGATMALTMTGSNSFQLIRNGSVKTEHVVKAASKESKEGYLIYKLDLGNGDGFVFRIWARGGSSTEGVFLSSSGKVLGTAVKETECSFGESDTTGLDTLVSKSGR